MELLFILMVMLAGAAMPVQSGINSQLQQHWAQSSILAATVSFAVGTLTLVAVTLAMRIPIPPISEVAGKTSFWHWAGGLLGAYTVTVMAYLAPRLGAATLITLFLSGQILISLLLDHFGVIGFAHKPLNWQRILGGALVGCGVLLIRRF